MRKKTIVFNLFLHLSACLVWMYPSHSSDENPASTTISSVSKKRQLRETAEELTQEDPSSKRQRIQPPSFMSFSISPKIIAAAKEGNFEAQEEILIKMLTDRVSKPDRKLIVEEMKEWKILPPSQDHPLHLWRVLEFVPKKEWPSEMETILKEKIAVKTSPLLPQYQWVYGKWCYIEGEYTQARYCFEQAAQQGNAYAQYFLGWMLLNGEGGAKDEVKARYWVEQAAKQGLATAQYHLGGMLFNGHGGEKDKVKTRYWYEQAAQQGLVVAQHLLGLMLVRGQGGGKDEVKARYWYEQAVQQGLAMAQYNLGVMLVRGQGGEKDEVKARYWLEQAAPQGEAHAQRLLGLMLVRGQGGGKDEVKARYWLEQAAPQGLDMAQYDLGCMLLNGQGGEKDEAKARYWYEQAAQQGLVVAQHLVGLMLVRGQGGEKDEVTGVKWWLKAAEKLPRAADTLAKRVRELIEVQGNQNFSGILKGLFEAAKEGHPAAQQHIQLLLPSFVLNKEEKREEFIKSLETTRSSVTTLAENEAHWHSHYTSSTTIQNSGMQDVTYNPVEEKFFGKNTSFTSLLKDILDHLGHPEIYPEGEERQHFSSTVSPGFMVKLNLNTTSQTKELISYRGTEKQSLQFIRYYPKFDAYCLGEDNIRLGDAFMVMYTNTATEETHTFKSYTQAMEKRFQEEQSNRDKVLQEGRLMEDKIAVIQKELLQNKGDEIYQQYLRKQLTKEELGQRLNRAVVQKLEEKAMKIGNQLTTVKNVKEGIEKIIWEAKDLRTDYLYATYPWLYAQS